MRPRSRLLGRHPLGLTTATHWPCQIWRLFTCFIFFGNFGLGFLFQLYFLCVCGSVRVCVFVSLFLAACCVLTHSVGTGRVGVFGSVKYSGMLEADPFPSGGGTHQGTTADYFYMLVIGALVMFVRLRMLVVCACALALADAAGGGAHSLGVVWCTITSSLPCCSPCE